MSDTAFTFPLALNKAERDALLEETARDIDALTGHLGASGTISTPLGTQVLSFKNDDIVFNGMPDLLLISKESIPPRQNQPIFVDELAKTYNFYVMYIPILLRPHGDWAYSNFMLHLKLDSEDAPSTAQPKTYTIFPEVKSATSATGVKGSGEVGVSVPFVVSPQIKFALEIDKTFQQTKALIGHSGINGLEAYLTIMDAGVLNNDLQVAFIIQVHKSAKTLIITGDMSATHDPQRPPLSLLNIFEHFKPEAQKQFKVGWPVPPVMIDPPWKFDVAANL